MIAEGVVVVVQGDASSMVHEVVGGLDAAPWDVNHRTSLGNALRNLPNKVTQVV